MAKQDDWARITLRIPTDLHRQLMQSAGAKSLNAEIVDRLEKSLSDTEEDLRHQIRTLEQKIEDFKSGLYVDMSNKAMEKAMVERMKEVMGTVVENLREEQRKTAGLPLLLKWFEQNPQAKADYNALRPIDQEAFVADKVHELWINHLNEKRAADGTRKAAEPARQRRVRLDDK